MAGPDTHVVQIVKAFRYRNNAAQEFSNRYCVGDATPPSLAQWETLCDNVVAAEKAIYPPSVHIVRARVWEADNPIVVLQKDYSLAGTFSVPSAGKQAPGDCAALVRYKTYALTTKGHPVYLFNYYHGVIADYEALGEQDFVVGEQVSAMQTYANHWVSGFSDGAHTWTRTGPRGADAYEASVEELITHRDFPR